MHIPDIKNSASKIQLSRISHVYFVHSNLDAFTTFAFDFGFTEALRTTISPTSKLTRIYFRGYGRDSYVYVADQSPPGTPSHFLGPAFVAKTAEDFEKAAKLPGATRTSLREEGAPGGGERVSFDRGDGTSFHVVYGIEDRTPDVKGVAAETRVELGPANGPFEKPRKGKFQRFQPGPSQVHKLGHLGYTAGTPAFDEHVAWYTSNFNFVPTDILHSPSDVDVDVSVFMHLDLGAEYTDHHSFFISRAAPGQTSTRLHHTSFEVGDFDEQMMGHEFLAAKGWESVWGVGRHILGSQIFDYWKDSSGFKIEHYADGDLVNDEIETRRDVAGPVSVWAPEMPADFFEGFEVPE